MAMFWVLFLFHLSWMAKSLLPLHTTNKSCGPCQCFQTSSGITADCSNQGLREIPKQIPDAVNHLLLRHNEFQELKPWSLKRFNSLRRLDLTSNSISAFHRNSFMGSPNLQTLNLNDNRLSLNENNYPVGLFRQQKQLMYLDISYNILSNRPNMSYPDKTFSHLVSLRSLSVDGLENAVFGEGFEKLKNLTSLTLSGQKGICTIRHIANRTFIHTPYLQFLDISNCILTDIDKYAFLPLRNIYTLDISNNEHLGFDRASISFYGLRFSRLRFLNASKLVETFAIGVELRTEHVKYLNDTKLEQVIFDNNRLELIESTAMQYLPYVKTLSLKGNRFTFGLYLLSLDRMTNLEMIDVSDQYQSYRLPFYVSELQGSSLTYEDKDNLFTELQMNDHHPNKRSEKDPIIMKDSVNEKNNVLLSKFDLELKQDEYTSTPRTDPPNPKDFITKDEVVKTFLNMFFTHPNFIIPIPPNLTHCHGSSMMLDYPITNLSFYANKIKYIDLSSNSFKRWIGPVSPLDYLEYLDLSNNYCNYMSPFFLHTFFNLLTLNISQNFLASSLLNDTEGMLFKNLSHLQTLRIHHNIIETLPRSLLQSVVNLQILDLSWNLLTTLTPDVVHIKTLRVLDISYNRFEMFPKYLRDQIDEIMKDSSTKFHLHVEGNFLKCTCDTLDSLKWMMSRYMVIEDKNTTFCSLTNETKISLEYLEDIVIQLQLDCKTLTPIIASVASGIVLSFSIVAAGIINRYRWKLRYLYYTTRRKYRGYQRLEDEAIFTYDAFVSYAEENRDFVVQDMCHVLEERFGLRLCIHQRDFMVGEPITANIINAIQSSRKTIVILSPDFVESSWCEYEVRMAKLESIHTGRDLLCVVWYADVPDLRKVTVDLREQIITDTYIIYPGDEQDREVFWKSMKESLEY